MEEMHGTACNYVDAQNDACENCVGTQTSKEGEPQQRSSPAKGERSRAGTANVVLRNALFGNVNPCATNLTDASETIAAQRPWTVLAHGQPAGGRKAPWQGLVSSRQQQRQWQVRRQGVQIIQWCIIT